MDHYSAVRQRVSFAFCAGAEQKRAHARRHTDADSADVALDIIHRVVYRKTVADGAAGGIDIEIYILIRILRLKKQQLRYDDGRGGVVYLLAEIYDPVY